MKNYKEKESIIDKIIGYFKSKEWFNIFNTCRLHKTDMPIDLKDWLENFDKYELINVISYAFEWIGAPKGYKFWENEHNKYTEWFKDEFKNELNIREPYYYKGDDWNNF